MPVFGVNQSQVTDVSRVQVENNLPAGSYRFQLVVQNGQGLQSDPVVQIVRVQPRPIPVSPGTGGVITGSQ